MNLDEIYKTNHDTLKSKDYHGKPAQILTIVGTDIAQFDDGPKLVLHFRELTGGLVVNKTNFSILSERLGTESDNYIGQRIKLEVRLVNYAGNMVPGFTIIMPSKAQAIVAPVPDPVPQVTDTGESFDDDIPF